MAPNVLAPPAIAPHSSIPTAPICPKSALACGTRQVFIEKKPARRAPFGARTLPRSGCARWGDRALLRRLPLETVLGPGREVPRSVGGLATAACAEHLAPRPIPFGRRRKRELYSGLLPLCCIVQSEKGKCAGRQFGAPGSAAVRVVVWVAMGGRRCMCVKHAWAPRSRSTAVWDGEANQAT